MPEVLTPVDKDDSLLSGRELDAAVAERVMGWKLINRRAMGWHPDGPDVWATGDAKNPSFQMFTPSASIAAAMEVVEKIRELDQDAEVEIVSAANLWGCTFAADRMDGNGFQQLGQSYDVSLPEAICRAALSAIEGK